MHKPSVDTNADIHCGQERTGIPQSHLQRDILHVLGDFGPHTPEHLIVLWNVCRCATEHHFAGPFPHKMADHLHPAAGRPVLFRRR